MVFVIQGMKYDTEKMRKVATVKKWYREDTFLNRAMFPGQKVGRTHECELWKSEKGNWLLTHEMDYSKNMGEAITERGSQGTFNEVCNANIRRNVWRVAGSVKGAKRNPVARWGTKTTGLELNTHIITQDIEEIKRFFLYIGRKAAIMAIRIISAAAGAAILILAALGFFAYAVMAKAWNELFD